MWILLFPTCIERIRSNNTPGGFDGYLNLERFHVQEEKEVFRSLNEGISRYGEMIRQESKNGGWDWRLVTAIIYRESRFNPRAGSLAGAVGLMQLMPETARRFRLNDILDPAQNIKGGIALMNWLNDQLTLEIPDPDERIKFVLAAYNAGLSHVADARRLAVKYGKNPSVWDDNVDYFIRNKSRRIFYSDPVVRSGYSKGEETFEFVRTVLRHYNNLTAYAPY